jgi:hypothetical protein
MNFFANFETDSRSASNSALFYIHIEFIQHEFLLISALFANFEGKRA